MLILSLFNSANLSFCLVSNTKDDVRDNVYGAKYKKKWRKWQKKDHKTIWLVHKHYISYSSFVLRDKMQTDWNKKNKNQAIALIPANICIFKLGMLWLLMRPMRTTWHLTHFDLSYLNICKWDAKAALLKRIISV